jgi:hypothetical protein
VVELRVPGQRREEALTVAAETCEAVELPALAAGGYLVSAEAPGYRRTERPVHLSSVPSASSLTLAEGIALSGQVVDAAGRPLSGVSVVVSPVEAVTRTDARGGFRLNVPSPGQYSIEAHHSDWGGAVQSVIAPSAPLRLRLEPRAQLELRVSSEGHPVKGAQAQLFQGRDAGGGREYASDRDTDADGGVRLLGFPPGPYRLEVTAPGFVVPFVQDVVLQETPVTELAVPLAPVPPGRVAGVVVDEAGRPLSGASVRAAPSAGVATAESDAEGRFQLQGLEGGLTYSVSARVVEAQSTAVSARAGDTALRLVALRPRLYRGRVLEETRAPIPAFRVGEVETVAADGRFALALPTDGGTVTFAVEAPGRTLTALVRPADAEDFGDIVLLPAPRVRGLVLEADGGAAADALVVCEGCRGEGGEERHLTTFSGEDGHFAIFITGPYGVLVRLLATKDGRVGWAEAGRAGEEAHLVLAAPSRVQGRVALPSGTPAPGVAVAFLEPLLETVFLVTGADGTFAGDVAPGLYQVTLLPDASRPRRTWTVQVPAGRVLELVTGDTRR